MTRSGRSEPRQAAPYEADLAARLILASLEQVGPARLRWLLGDDDPITTLEMLASGQICAQRDRPPIKTLDLLERWARQAASADGELLCEQQASIGAGFLTPLDAEWPFAQEADPPLVVFLHGDRGILGKALPVGVVGTRRCTSVGRTVAYNLGRDLASAGLPVVSGLALGIDGAAHRGVLDAGGSALAVVGSGLDVVYPKANTSLWHEVAQSGLVLTECLAGTTPERWRFPARNRLIAALSSAIVVVESHHRGGSLLTADEAVERALPVFAVPGSVLSPASSGTNGLLRDGAIPLVEPGDVVNHLDPSGIHSRAGAKHPQSNERGVPEVEGVAPRLVRLVLEETSQGPVHLGTLVLASRETTASVVSGVQRMVLEGLVETDGSTVVQVSDEHGGRRC